MSDEAIAWVLAEAPDLPPHLVGTLLVLAIGADEDGRGTRFSQPTIGWYARKTARAVRKDLVQLEHDVKLIKRGDQRLVEHIPADERPIVWDLEMARKRDPEPTSDRNHSSVRALLDRNHSSAPSEGTGTTVPVESEEGPEPQFLSNEAGTGTTVPVQPEGAEPQFLSNAEGQEPQFRLQKKRKRISSSSSPPSPTARIADALDLTDDEAQQTYDRVIAERRPNAPGRYIDALIASGDIASFRPSAPKPAKASYNGPICAYVADPHSGCCATCGLPDTHPRHGSQP